MSKNSTEKNGVVVIEGSDGHTVISKGSPLKRLHYFDGKFLRAADLDLDQQAFLNQVRLSNQAGGGGVVRGFSCVLVDGNSLEIGPGLAVDPEGRILHMTENVQVSIPMLIEKSKKLFSKSKIEAAASGTTPSFGDCESLTEKAPETVFEDVRLYRVTVGHAEAHCGTEDVYGKLCEEACISDTERPYAIEGVVIRAEPLNLPLDFPASVENDSQHLRSLAASAYFEAEWSNPGSLISGEGLFSSIWCMGAKGETGVSVPLAVFAWDGSQAPFLDNWIARREKMETPPSRYWAGRMAMRPWNVFLAQILQFQCQLTSCFRESIGKVKVYDPCEEEHHIARKASDAMKSLLERYEKISARFSIEELKAADVGPLFMNNLKDLQKGLADIADTAVANRYLIGCGILELPSAGYLPVITGDAVTVNTQVRRMMGEGVDLRFCAARQDYVPHALEEAQHMERISLLEGIDTPENKPKVDVIVPDGRIELYQGATPGIGYKMDMVVQETLIIFSLATKGKKAIGQESLTLFNSVHRMFTVLKENGSLSGLLQGAARAEQLETGGIAFYHAAKSSGTARGLTSGVANAMSKAVIRPIDAISSPTSGLAGANTVRAAEHIRILASSIFTRPEKTQEPLQVLWTSLRMDHDPFNMRLRQSTRLSAEVVFLLSYVTGGATITLIQQASLIKGQLKINEIQSGGDKIQIVGQLRGRLLLDASINDGDLEEMSNQIDLNETVHISRMTSNGSMLTTIASISRPTNIPEMGNVVLRFENTWQNAGTATFKAEIAGKATTRTGDSTVDIFSGTRTVDSDVLLPSHPLHGESLASLNILTDALNDDQYTDTNQQLLFPAPEPVPDELKVYATFHDWVLFHRRRDVVCELSRIPEAMVKPRVYRVFHINVANSDQLSLFKDAIEENSQITGTFDPQEVTSIEFEAGVYCTRTGIEDIRGHWKNEVKIDAEISLAVIASQGEAREEGSTLAELRLENLLRILKTEAEVADGCEPYSIDLIPDILPHGDVDGVIVLATLGINTVCHNIHRIEGTSEEIDSFAKYLDRENYLEPLKKYGAEKPIGTTKFISGTSDLFGNQAAEQIWEMWQNAGNGTITRVFSIANVNAFENSPNPHEVVKDQALCIAEATKSMNAIENVYLKETGTEILGCPAITVLAIEKTCNDIYLFAKGSLEESMSWDLLKKQIEGGMLTEYLSDQIKRPWFKVCPIRFTKNSDGPLAESIEILNEMWDSRLSLQATHVFSVSPQNDENADVYERQSEYIKEILGLDKAEVVPVKDTKNEKLPGSCPTISVIFVDIEVDPEIKTVCNDVYIFYAGASESSMVTVDKLINDIEAGTLSQSLEDPIQLPWSSVCLVKFEENSDVILAESLEILIEKWNSTANNKVTHVISVSTQNDGNTDLYEKQSIYIKEKLGLTRATVVPVKDKKNDKLPGSCPAITVIYIKP